MAPKWHEKLSPQGREALEQGFNPQSMSDEDFAVWSKHNPKRVETEGMEDEDEDEGEDE